MNAKQCKRLRRVARTIVPSAIVEYENSTLETEKPHTKIYYRDSVKYTRAGIKNYKHKVPITVGTIKLKEGCQKNVYRQLKQANKPL